MGRLVLILLLAGCSTPEIRLTALPDGSYILEHAGIDCPTRKDTGGCFIRVKGASYFPFNDDEAKHHEREHGLDGEHSDMLTQASGAKCGVITKQGRSSWVVGNLICRGRDGRHYQVAR